MTLHQQPPQPKCGASFQRGMICSYEVLLGLSCTLVPSLENPDVDLFSVVALRYGVGLFSSRLQTSNNALCIIAIFRKKVCREAVSDFKGVFPSIPARVGVLDDACVS